LLEQLAMSGSPADFVKSFAMKVPGLVTAHILGVSFDDAEVFQSRRKAEAHGGLAAPDEIVRANDKMCAYIDGILERKMPDAEKGEDLICRLLRDYVIPGHLSREQCISAVQLLIEAGLDTTGTMIAFGTLSLFLNPQQKDELVGDPSLVPAAVEEMLRFHTIAHLNATRAAVADFEINGIAVSRGEGVLCMLNSANRDPSAFPEPDRFDIHRDARHHVAFGFGPHQCLGQPLARLELQLVFSKLFQRFPGLQLAVPLSELKFRPTSPYSVEELPVSW
jgi:cytochrome P450